MRPFRFKGKIDPFFQRIRVPLENIRDIRRVRDRPAAVDGDASDVELSCIDDTPPLKEAVESIQSDSCSNVTNAPCVIKESQKDYEPVNTVKGPTMIRQLINLGKRGTEVGAEGGWDDEEAFADKNAAINHKIRKQQRELLGKRQSGEWNKMLDSGRTKKVKKVKEDQDEYLDEGKLNPFQNFEDNNKFRKRF